MESKFYIDVQRRDEVLSRLVQKYREHWGVFATNHYFFGSAPQQINIPNGVAFGSHEHIVFEFFVTLITLQSNSAVGFRQAVQLYQHHAILFHRGVLEIPREVFVEERSNDLFFRLASTRSVDPITLIFEEYGLNRPTIWADRWRGCAETLFTEYNGNPLAIFQDIPTVDEFIRNKKHRGKGKWFKGMGPKLFSLLAIFYEELRVIDPVPDAIPVDVHLQNIALATGIVTCRDVVVPDQPLAEKLRADVYVDFCQKGHSTNHELSHAAWFLGSSLCTRCSRTPDIEHSCPIYAFCRGRYPTKEYWKKGRWNLALHPHRRGTLFSEMQYTMEF